jgi:hypothetical protein
VCVDHSSSKKSFFDCLLSALLFQTVCFVPYDYLNCQYKSAAALVGFKSTVQLNQKFLILYSKRREVAILGTKITRHFTALLSKNIDHHLKLNISMNYSTILIRVCSDTDPTPHLFGIRKNLHP